ncbi:ATP-binding protein [Serpentinicella alkaliphila]|uniref:4Fe-4S binding protein n=1 Tax=Serpentinicella alkaliphila TaxID=1734049 RepID=A0A4V2T4B5_9FIRM|nr:4Fe-4S binding protein [Serpentinicella alkaliphila]QUH24540.1 4Fe-4S binding protein [Serpentinicella alkaliphila]TCQ04634.1 4Fe-4S binding protein [Serpentinicella alkaliphila]
MAIRKIIEIDENKCDGCGLCVPGCEEGAIQIIEGKAKLVSDIYCDGLGACLGHCPQGALNIVEREADEFDEVAVEKLLASQGKTFKPQHETQKNTPQVPHTPHHHGHGCPGSRMMNFNEEPKNTEKVSIGSEDIEVSIKPQLRQWPVQLNLVPVNAPYFENADLLVTADCVPFAYPNYHIDLLKGKALAIGCPKLDDVNHYIEKLTQIIKNNNLKSITVAYMEVPCCMGIVMAVDQAVANAKSDVKVNKVKIGIKGQRIG